MARRKHTESDQQLALSFDFSTAIDSASSDGRMSPASPKSALVIPFCRRKLSTQMSSVGDQKVLDRLLDQAKRLKW